MPMASAMMAKLMNSKMLAVVSTVRWSTLAEAFTSGPSSRKALFCSSWDCPASGLAVS